MNTSCPWVEKHRPTEFNDIVLNEDNKKILKNMIEQRHFCHLLFYGPPGTGKTTTIINLVKAFQQKWPDEKGDMIHLNASDERGIDVIRTQISSFVNSKPLFNFGLKFIILDEVDYMTKNAQQALKNLLQTDHTNIRFCLICNYISKIDDSLQNEFVKLRFNQLPQQHILSFLNQVCEKEELSGISLETLESIQQLFKSDIRSMLNFLQSNQNGIGKIINNCVWKHLFEKIKRKEHIQQIIQYMEEISREYNIDIKNMVKKFVNYLIQVQSQCVNESFLNALENIIHFPEVHQDHYLRYFLLQITV